MEMFDFLLLLTARKSSWSQSFIASVVFYSVRCFIGLHFDETTITVIWDNHCGRANGTKKLGVAQAARIRHGTTLREAWNVES